MSVPSILQNKPLLHPTDMNIQSEILFPIQFNQRSTRFVFDNKGVLDSNSRINLAVVIQPEPSSQTPAVLTEELATTDAERVRPITSDYAQFETRAYRINGGAFPQFTAATVSTLDFTDAEILPELGDGLVVGDQILDVDNNNMSTVTSIVSSAGTTVVSVSPDLPVAPTPGGKVNFFSRGRYLIDEDPATSNVPPSSVDDYYNGQMVRLGLTVNDNVYPLQSDIVQARVLNYFSTGIAGQNVLTIDRTTLVLASDGTSPLGDAQNILSMTGDVERTRLGCVYNPYSIVLGVAQAEVDGFWDGYFATASQNVSPEGTPIKVVKYWADGAVALAQGVAEGINVINPANRTAYLEREGRFFDGWVVQVGTGGQTSVTMELGEQFIKGMLPISTGVSSLIRRAVLTIGGREVSSLDAVGHFTTITNLLNSQEHRQKILYHLEGVNDAMTFRDSAAGEDGYIGLVDGDIEDEVFITIPKALEIRDLVETTPRFSIALSSLIPMMKGVKLPLFAINQEVSLLIEWSADLDGHRIISHRPEGIGHIKTDIVESECFMMCDYLYYDKEMMAVMQEIQENDWVLPYEDVITIDAQLAALAEEPSGATPFNFTRTSTDTLLYLGGKTVRSILVQKQSDNPTFTNIGNNKLEGIYNSRSFQRPETYNLLVDNVPFYDTDLTLNGLHYQEFARCFDTPLQIPNARYSMANMVNEDFDFDRNNADGYITDKPFGGVETTVDVSQSRALTGNQNYYGINLGNAAGIGVKMSNLPAIFRHTTQRKSTNEEWSDSILYKFYATIKRGMAIRQGGFVMTVE
jgi:hypothetical protein